MPVLSVRNLTKNFQQSILNQINFSIKKATITGFLGANGSGKTTTFKCVLGLLPFEKGEVLFFDEQPLSRSVLKKVGFLPEQPCFYPYLTGEELLMFYGQLTIKTKFAVLKSRVRALLKKLDLSHVKDHRLHTYSKGMLQKIGIAQALVHEPELVILDEPLAGGLDSEGQLCVKELLQRQVQDGMSVFFSTHQVCDVEELCHHLVVLKNKTVHYTGSAHTWFHRLSQQWGVDITAERTRRQILEKKFATML